MRRLSALAAAVLALSFPAQALDVKSFARDLDPCTDFYDYVNGPWVAQTELPASRSRIGSFDQLRMANDAILEQALRELLSHPALQTTPGLKQAAAYFASGMDQAAIEAAGLKALQPLLDPIHPLNT